MLIASVRMYFDLLCPVSMYLIARMNKGAYIMYVMSHIQCVIVLLWCFCMLIASIRMYLTCVLYQCI
jgi:hypothetical protein